MVSNEFTIMFLDNAKDRQMAPANLVTRIKGGMLVNGICKRKYLVYTGASFSQSRPLGQT